MTLPREAVSPPTILCSTDGSPASEGAVQAAFTLARRWRGRLVVLQILEFNPGFASQAIDYLHQWEREVQNGLEDLRARAARQGLEMEILVRGGEAAYRVIVTAAASLPAGLVVLGRHGRTGLSRLLMGSVTARVIGLSPANVLVVPRNAPLTFRRFLVAGDGSPYSRAAWGEALALAPAWQSELVAVSVARSGEVIPEVESILQEMLEEAAGTGVSPTALVLEGEPDQAIVRAALDREADLIILGSHGRTGLTRLLMGSVAERVIGQAACPVLVVKLRE